MILIVEKIEKKNPIMHTKGMAEEFMEFMQKYGVIALAIAFVMGAAAKDYVTAFVDAFINPLLGYLLPNADNLTQWVWYNFRFGDFILATINFIVIALVIFMIAKFVMRQEKVEKI